MAFDGRVRNLLIGIALGFMLKLVWSAMDLPANVNVPVVNRTFGIVYLVGGIAAIYGYFRRKTLMWIGLGMLVGIYLREITMTSPA